jgi:hypothetical protein
MQAVSETQPRRGGLRGSKRVTGSIVSADGSRVEFAARNPYIGRPYIDLRSNNSDQSRRVELSEDEVSTVTLNGNVFRASREADTDASKMLTLSVG